MKITELDYDLPPSLIAQAPLPDRADSRLLVLHRRTGIIEHRRFRDICRYFRPGDCLVINDSKVIPARFTLRRATGGRVDGLFLSLTDTGQWQVLLRNADRVRPREDLRLIPPDPDNQDNPHDRDPPRLIRTVTNCRAGIWIMEPQFTESHLTILEQYGVTPLPPYIHRGPDATCDPEDRRRYQTVYARTPGSVAAPTAGLHFTDEILAQATAAGVNVAHVTLHVGLGTFRPISTDSLEDHQMHAEYYSLDSTNSQIINQALSAGKRVIAVGTTSVRTLETLAHNGRVEPGSGATQLFITPGYEFKAIGAMLTNFHLPRSTLLALVCAFAGADHVLNAYRQAVDRQYRFYSYGDATLII